MSQNKTYIGDGVYASDSGDEILLETERLEGRHYIYLSNNELDGLLQLVARTRGFKIKIEHPVREGKETT